jgi:hypothetical protein
MKLRSWVPEPVAWLCAVLLFAFSSGWSFAVAIVLPALFELMRYSPRLAWLGIFSLWIGPIAAVTMIHRVGHAALDVADRRSGKGESTALQSLWAGVYAWLVLFLTSVTTVLLMLVVDPPPPPRPDGLLATVAGAFAAPSLGARSALWILIAACLYHVERSARARG